MAATSMSGGSANPRELSVANFVQSVPGAAIPVSREHAVNAKKGRAGSLHQEDGATSNAAVVQMWFCFVFGVVCVSYGIMGIWTSYSQVPSSIYFARLGSAYVPVLRANAAACLILGAILVRRGWRRS